MLELKDLQRGNTSRWDSTEKKHRAVHPYERIHEALSKLGPLPLVVYNPGLVILKTCYGQSSLMRLEEFGVHWIVGEYEEEYDSPDESDGTDNDEKPNPRTNIQVTVNVANAISKETTNHLL